ncbi:PASTA domain-containing protein [Flavobacterium pallidum]|uniref:PASTA domain-containing protein n=1 Tax=Flavobacterium pallidum TaxID=2172098 RepID=A0A2S1SJX9_9FLAO|nr:PASTA domain-containing protein [Flavobacterium pallidum]AWI26708.1 PASTA domain-containing protein [Flavobacterium pallidum]
MSLRNYLTSKVFFRQLALAFLILLVIGFLLLQWISFSTKHGQEITVPNLAKMSIEQAEEVLDNADLDYEVLDTVDFNPDYPKFTIVKQDPLAGAKVKEDRKIYIKINSGGFNSVRVPNLIEQTLRQAVPTLQSIGLQQGKITYKPYLGKDMVLEMMQNGKVLKPGDKVLKSSKIDLVVGDGKVGFDEENETETDTTSSNN